MKRLYEQDGSLKVFYPLQDDLLCHTGRPSNNFQLTRINNANNAYLHTIQGRTCHSARPDSKYLKIDNFSEVGYSIHEPFSVSFWFILLSNVTTEATAFAITGSTNISGYYFSVNTSYRPTFFFGGNKGSSDGLSVTSGHTLQVGVWYHATLTYDGSTSANGMKIYINGKTSTQTTNFSTPTTRAWPYNIALLLAGYITNTSTLVNFPGAISLFRIYNRMLSAVDVNKLFYQESRIDFANREQIKGFVASTSSFTLYTCGSLTQSSGISLYASGYDNPTATMPLSVLGPTGNYVENTLQLFTFSTTNSGVIASMPLVMASGNNEITASMNLFLQGRNSADVTSYMNLFLGGRYPTSINVLNLVVFNDFISSGISLFIEGSGETDGAIPYRTNMNLYLNRPTSNVMNLYLHGRGTDASGSLPLNVLAGVISNSGIPLVIANAVGPTNSGIPLYVHGF